MVYLIRMLAVRLTSQQQHEQSLQTSLMSPGTVTKSAASPLPTVLLSGRRIYDILDSFIPGDLFDCRINHSDVLVNTAQPRKEWMCVFALQVSWCL